MALIDCPECKNQISDSAEVCPHCGIRLKQQDLSCLPHKCPNCGSNRIKKTREAKSSGMGCLLMIIGILLIIFFFWTIIIPILGGLILLFGLNEGSKCNFFYVCKNCGNKFHRVAGTFEIG